MRQGDRSIKLLELIFLALENSAWLIVLLKEGSYPDLKPDKILIWVVMQTKSKRMFEKF